MLQILENSGGSLEKYNIEKIDPQSEPRNFTHTYTHTYIVGKETRNTNIRGSLGTCIKY